MKRLVLAVLVLGLLIPSITFGQWKIVYPDKPLWINSIGFVSDAKVYAAGIGGLWVSKNSGEGWNENANWNTLLYSYQGISIVDSNTIWLTTYGNVFIRSVDGGNTWKVINNGTSDGIATKTFWLNSNVGYACGGTEKLLGGDTLSQGGNLFWKTSNGGSTWHVKTIGKDYAGFRQVVMSKNGKGFLISVRKIYLTNDDGENWSVLNFNLHDQENFGYMYFANEKDGLLFNYTFTNGAKTWIYKTNDGGNTWSEVYKFNDLYINGENSVVVNGLNNVKIVGVSDLGRAKILSSIDFCSTWNEEYAHPVSGEINLFAIASRGRVSIAAGDYIFRSDNSLIIPSLSNSTVIVGDNFVKQLPLHDSEGDSLIYTLESAPSFLQIDGCCIKGVPSSSDTGTYQVVVNVTDTRLNTTSSFKLTVDNTVGVEDEAEAAIPTSYKLDQNYPNPFNPSTTISYSIPKSSRVKIVIYNSLGQLIETLVDREESVGNHQVIFNTKNNLPSGIYFYNIIAGEYTNTKKMLMIK